MVVFEDECVGYDTYCINYGRKHTPHYYCDECGEEIDDPESDTHYCSKCSRKFDEEYEDFLLEFFLKIRYNIYRK